MIFSIHVQHKNWHCEDGLLLWQSIQSLVLHQQTYKWRGYISSDSRAILKQELVERNAFQILHVWWWTLQPHNIILLVPKRLTQLSIIFILLVTIVVYLYKQVFNHWSLLSCFGVKTRLYEYIEFIPINLNTLKYSYLFIDCKQLDSDSQSMLIDNKNNKYHIPS